MPVGTVFILHTDHELPEAAEPASLEAVGGKALSLLTMGEAGLPVPPGAVLGTAFFEPWFEQVRESGEWQALTDAAVEDWPDRCAAVQRMAEDLALTPDQDATLGTLGESLDGLVAVRSSSPDEDLATASFAGGYVTTLGVRPADLEAAVRACFVSSLEHRVFAYKRQQGLDPFAPRLAVIVQRQLDSDVAGVAFSLDPLTNDYDHAVIDANWGLGESVVAGLVTPDHWVVDKVDRRVIEATVGAKQRVISLDEDGGTIEQATSAERASAACLDAEQLDALVDLVCRVETLYGQPMDIEWAIADGDLHLLQARPITTHVPLPPELLTEPGERRRLYTDIALSSGFTINAPISPMGLSWMRDSVLAIAELFLGRLDLELGEDDAFWIFAGSRMYQDTSNMLWLMSTEKMAKAAVETDPLMAATLAAIDTERYRPAVRPVWARLSMVRILPRFLWRLRPFVFKILTTLAAPERAKRRFDRETAAFEEQLDRRLDLDLPLAELRRRATLPTMRYLFEVTMPALAAGMVGVQLAERLVGSDRSEERKELADALQLGFPGNVVVEMGIALVRLARQLDPHELDDVEALARRIEERRMPTQFLAAWDAFLDQYGHRGPLEMDLARPRYADDPRLALRQMASMRQDDPAFDPEASHRRLVDRRRAAVDRLLRQIGGWRRPLLRRAHRVVECFAGTRDTPKHHNLLLHRVMRRRVLIEGERLVAAGRLDRADEVFHLTLDDLERAANDPELELRRRGEERMAFYRRLDGRVSQFPAMIDSRGRIPRPPARDEAPGELRGVGLSSGRVSGPVKVLRTPDEKPVDMGDILVAYATDPGWTPLFANAAAVVLEVGGVLQHGALVAREYGKPCVAGIDRLLERLEDGQRVEVDGASGLVRILDADPDQPTNL